MKRAISCAIAVALLSFGHVAGAQSVQGNGRLSQVHVMRGGVVLFTSDGSRSQTPTCHTMPNRWAFDATTPAGQAMLSVILTAYSSGKRVDVHGTGLCSAWLDTETVEFINTID